MLELQPFDRAPPVKGYRLDPSIERRAGEESARFALQDPAREPCAICGEPRTQVALFFTGGLMVRLHETCEALWKQERGS